MTCNRRPAFVPFHHSYVGRTYGRTVSFPIVRRPFNFIRYYVGTIRNVIEFIVSRGQRDKHSQVSHALGSSPVRYIKVKFELAYEASILSRSIPIYWISAELRPVFFGTGSTKIGVCRPDYHQVLYIPFLCTK